MELWHGWYGLSIRILGILIWIWISFMNISHKNKNVGCTKKKVYILLKRFSRDSNWYRTGRKNSFIKINFLVMRFTVSSTQHLAKKTGVYQHIKQISNSSSSFNFCRIIISENSAAHTVSKMLGSKVTAQAPANIGYARPQRTLV